MNTTTMALDILIEAINSRKVLSYEYNKAGEPYGERIGHPYAVFIYTSKKTGLSSTKVHMVQVDGVSKSVGTKPFPSFRMHNLEELTNVQILDHLPCFESPFHSDYNAESEMYIDVIVKI